MLRILILWLLTFYIAFATATVHAAEPAKIPAAYRLSVSDVERAASAALAAKGAGERVSASVLGAKSAVLYESVKPLSPRLTGVNFDKAGGRWNANLLIMSGEEVVTAMPVTGRYQEVLQLPVLKRQVRSGETITAVDIDTLEFPLVRTRSDAVTNAAQLIGFSPRTVISPKRPIRASEIAVPALLKKNAVILMHYKSGGMEITTNGQALSDGARGEMIEVRNLTSKTVVRGVVEDEHTVNITPLVQRRELAGEPHATVY